MKTKYLETIKALDGIVYNLEYHQSRLEAVLRSLGRREFHNLQEHLLPPSDGLYRCRVVYDEETLLVTYHPYQKRIINRLKIIYDDTIEYDKKYANREEIDKLFLLRENCDDILIVKNSLITDSSIANIALYDGKEWVTPKSPLLKGTTRARLLAESKIVEKEILITEIESYSKVALMNAMVDFDIIAVDNVRKIFVR